MITSLKATAVDTSNLKPGENIHMDFDFYNVTSIREPTSILTFVFEKSKMIWVLHTASKKSPVHIICFILTIFKNKQHP